MFGSKVTSPQRPGTFVPGTTSEESESYPMIQPHGNNYQFKSNQNTITHKSQICRRTIEKLLLRRIAELKWNQRSSLTLPFNDLCFFFFEILVPVPIFCFWRGLLAVWGNSLLYRAHHCSVAEKWGIWRSPDPHDTRMMMNDLSISRWTMWWE